MFCLIRNLLTTASSARDRVVTVVDNIPAQTDTMKY